jgi:hypothetical protein
MIIPHQHPKQLAKVHLIRFGSLRPAVYLNA